MNKTPPRSAKNRSQPAPVPQVAFTVSVEWEMQQCSSVTGIFKINLPQPFPAKVQTNKIPVVGSTGSKSITVNLSVDENAVNTMISTPFLFQLFIPQEVSQTPTQKGHIPRMSRAVEKFQDGFVQLDGHNILLPNRKTTSYTCHTGAFAKITFTLSISDEIFSQTYLSRFSPVFLHIKKVENMPNSPNSFEDLAQTFAPVSFCVCMNDNEFQICPQMHQTNHILDVVVVKSPRTQSEVKFEVHDRAKLLPSTSVFVGNGLIEPFIPHANMKGLFLDPDKIIEPDRTIQNPFGSCQFKLLPSRKNRASILPVISHKSPVPPGNFRTVQTELCYEVVDPVSDSKTLVQERSLPQPVQKQPPIPLKQSRKKQGTTSFETFESDYFRWILVANRTNQAENYARMLHCLVNEHHKQILNVQSESVLQTYNYEKSIATCIDVITGFHLITPDEHVIIIESRADEPNLSLQKLTSFFKSKPPEGVTMFFSREERFCSPRQYSTFTTLFHSLEIPVNILDLVKVEQLYFHSSSIYVLFDVVQKLTGIIQASEFKEINTNDFYPNVSQLMQLMIKGDSLPAYIKKKEEEEPDMAKNFANMLKSLSIARTAKTSMSVRTLVNPRSALSSRADVTSSRAAVTSRTSRTEKKSGSKPERARFSLYGKPKEVKRAPNERIAVSSNGDTEIWCTTEPELLERDGWTVEVIKGPATSRGKRAKTSFLPFSPND